MTQTSPRQSLADDVAGRVMAAINSGEFRAGDQLPPETVLAQRFNVGRTSVREGVGKLRMLGAVEVRRGLGTFVTDSGQTDPQLAFLQWAAEHSYRIIDIFEVRMALEVAAAASACRRATFAELQGLEHAARDHGAAHEKADLASLVSTDQEFHSALITCSHNEALRHVYNILVPQLLDYRRKSLALSGAAHRSADDHMAIVRAVRDRDPELARKAVMNHLDTLYAEILATTSGRSEDGERGSSG